MPSACQPSKNSAVQLDTACGIFRPPQRCPLPRDRHWHHRTGARRSLFVLIPIRVIDPLRYRSSRSGSAVGERALEPCLEHRRCSYWLLEAGSAMLEARRQLPVEAVLQGAASCLRDVDDVALGLLEVLFLDVRIICALLDDDEGFAELAPAASPRPGRAVFIP